MVAGDADSTGFAGSDDVSVSPLSVGVFFVLGDRAGGAGDGADGDNEGAAVEMDCGWFVGGVVGAVRGDSDSATVVNDCGGAVDVDRDARLSAVSSSSPSTSTSIESAAVRLAAAATASSVESNCDVVCKSPAADCDAMAVDDVVVSDVASCGGDAEVAERADGDRGAAEALAMSVA